MGRHTGAFCTACRQRILVRGGRLIEHQHTFPSLGTSVSCVGSYAKQPAGTPHEPVTNSAPVGRAMPGHPVVSQPPAAVSR
jgi:hypothetical protein